MAILKGGLLSRVPLCVTNLDIFALNSFFFFLFPNMPRTARGDKQGCALSFVGRHEMSLFEEVEAAQKPDEGKSPCLMVIFFSAF